MTHPRPPRLGERALRAAFRDDPALPAILGDLEEDFHADVRDLGSTRARLRHLRACAGLATGRALHDLMRTLTGPSTMHDALRPTGLLQDLGYAVRSLRRAPGFAVLTALVVGLGVGATTAVFSVVKPLLIAPLPVEAPRDLVWIALDDGNEESLSSVTSRTGNLIDFRERASSFDGITGFNAFSGQESYTLEADGNVQRLTGYGVAPDFLDVLGVRPAFGRDFDDAESTWDGPAAIVLSWAFFQQRFGGDPGIVGTSVALNGEPTRVIGVLPAAFDFGSIFTPAETVHFLEVWEISDRTDRWGNTLHMIGRLRDGVSAEAAQAELDAVVASLEAEQPDRWGLGAHVTPLQEKISAPVRSGLLLLAGAAATVLLIVCVNVSNMLLARAPGRAREIAVRKALGAGRGRLLRQLLGESTIIAVTGSVAGAAIAWGVTRWVSATAGVKVPLLDTVGVDGTALLFAVGVAVATGLVVGWVPALQVAEGSEATVLRSGGRSATATRGAHRLREGLVIAEIALAAVLLVAGGLLIRSFGAVMDVDLGFDPEGTVAWKLNPQGMETNAEYVAWFRGLEDRLMQIPGVEAVGMNDALPLGRNRSWGFSVEGLPQTEADDLGMFPHIVTAGYFGALDIPLLAGRTFERNEAEDAQTIVINRSAAERLFGHVDGAVGQRFSTGRDAPWEIVGVVEDTRHVSPESDAGIQVYFPIAQMADWSSMEMAVRSSLPTARTVDAVSAAIGEWDSTIPAREFWTLEDSVGRAVSARRFLLQVLTAFGAAALLLAALGVYGVLACSVAERRAEIGIRMALGATAGAVLGSIVRQTLALAVVGIGLGLVASMAVNGLLASLLFGVGAGDPRTLAVMSAVLLAVAAAAGLIPAIRAARLNGVRALRSE